MTMTAVAANERYVERMNPSVGEYYPQFDPAAPPDRGWRVHRLFPSSGKRVVVCAHGARTPQAAARVTFSPSSFRSRHETASLAPCGCFRRRGHPGGVLRDPVRRYRRPRSVSSTHLTL